MKQGKASRDVTEVKREPIPHAINPGGAAQLGTHVIQNPTQLNAGRGYSAPKMAGSSHPCGSQGKH